MKRIIIYITAIIIAYFVVYFAIKNAVQSEVSNIIRQTMREEFAYDRATFKFIIEEKVKNINSSKYRKATLEKV